MQPALEHEYHSYDLVEALRTPETFWLGIILDPSVHGYLGAAPPSEQERDVAFLCYREVQREVCQRLNMSWTLPEETLIVEQYDALCDMLTNVDPASLRLVPDEGHVVQLHPELQAELDALLITLQYCPMDLCFASWGSSTRKEYYPVLILHPREHGSVADSIPGPYERDVLWLGYEQSVSRVNVADLGTLQECVPLLLQRHFEVMEKQLLHGFRITLEEVKLRVGAEPGVEPPADADLHSLVNSLSEVLDSVQPPEDLESRLQANSAKSLVLQRSVRHAVNRLETDRAARQAPAHKTYINRQYSAKLNRMKARRASNEADPTLQELMRRFRHNLETSQPDPNLRICTCCFQDLSVLPEHPDAGEKECYDNPYIEGFYYCGDCQRKCRICGEHNMDTILMCKSMCSAHVCYSAWCAHCLDYWGGTGLFEELRQERDASPDWHCPLCHPHRSKYGLFQRHKDWKLNLFFLYELTPSLRRMYDPRLLAGQHIEKVCSVFNGSGAIFGLLRELGCKLDEEKCVSYEIDHKANLLSQAHCPKVQQRYNVKKMNMEQLHQLAEFDLLVGGPPCQEFTLANPRGQGTRDPDKSGALTTYFSQFYQTAAVSKDSPIGFLMENVKMSNDNRGSIEQLFRLRSIELDASKHGEVSRRTRIFISNAPYFFFPYFQSTRVLDDILSEGRHARLQDDGQPLQHLRTLTSNPVSRTALGGDSNLLVVDAQGRGDRLRVTEYEESLGYKAGYTGVTLPDGTTLTEKERMTVLSQGWPLTVVRQILERFLGPPKEVPGYKLYSTCPLLQEHAQQ